MKDYSNNIEERKDFILSYKVDESKKSIRVQYADGSFKRFVYTEKLEKDILKKMKIQINKAYKNYKKIGKDYDKMNIASLISFACTLLTLTLGAISAIGFLVPFLFGSFSVFMQTRAFKLKSIKDDLRKNYLFLKNEHAINDKDMCKRAFKYCYKKDVKEKVVDKKVKFTINDCEEFTFDEMVYLDNKLQYYRERENEKYANNCVKRKCKVK